MGEERTGCMKKMIKQTIALLLALWFVLLAVLADMLRQQMFRLLRVKSRVHRLADRLFRAKVNG